MSIDKLTFSFNWNGKLFCKYFTTIRPHFKNRFTLNKQFDCYLKLKSENYFVGRCTCIGVKSFLLDEIPEFFVINDLGYNYETSIRIIKTIFHKCNFDYSKQLFDIVHLRNENHKAIYDQLNDYVLSKSIFDPELNVKKIYI